MKKGFLVLVSGCAMLTACGDVRDTLGLRRSSPDEFKVIATAPLEIPPDFTLRPPRPGAKRPQAKDTDSQAKELIFNNPGGNNSGEGNILLKRAGAENVDPNIKSEIDEENRLMDQTEEDKGIFSKTVDYMRGEDKKDEPIVDSKKEKERIKENETEGKPVNEGNVPEVKEKDKGLLNRALGL